MWRGRSAAQQAASFGLSLRGGGDLPRTLASGCGTLYSSMIEFMTTDAGSEASCAVMN